MDFNVECIKAACDLHNVNYSDLMKSMGLAYYYNDDTISLYTFDTVPLYIKLLDSEKIKISKELNTVIPYFYGIINDELLRSNKLTLDEYENAVNSYTLDKYFISLGLKEYLKHFTVIELDNKLFQVKGEDHLTRAEINSIVTFLNNSKTHLFSIDDLPANEEIYINLVKVQPFTLRDLKFQTEEICITAVSNFAHAIEYVLEQTENIAYAAVTKNGLALEYVDQKFHTERVVKAALKQNPLSFRFSYLKTYDICLIAVKSNGVNYEFVPEEFRTHEMKMEALNSNGWAIKFFDIQTEEYALKAVLQNPDTCLYIYEDIRENNTLIKLMYPEVVKKHSFLIKHANSNTSESQFAN